MAAGKLLESVPVRGAVVLVLLLAPAGTYFSRSAGVRSDSGIHCCTVN